MTGLILGGVDSMTTIRYQIIMLPGSARLGRTGRRRRLRTDIHRRRPCPVVNPRSRAILSPPPRTRQDRGDGHADWSSTRDYPQLMRPAVAISELEQLKSEGTEDAQVVEGGERFESWRARVRSLLARSLGGSDHIVKTFDEIRYGLTISTTSTPASAWIDARRGGIRRACGLIDAAVYELRLLQGNDEPIDERAFDPQLWNHVKGVVEAEDWGKVASQVAIFVEDRVRVWSGRPKDRSGDDLVGKGLYAEVFADNSEFRLGRRRGEWEGWRMLAMGFAQATSNVDRHHIQDRDDARRYALGVLGLGSLLLTQLRHEHGDHLAED
jgi:hypothetical protein